MKSRPAILKSEARPPVYQKNRALRLLADIGAALQPALDGARRAGGDQVPDRVSNPITPEATRRAAQLRNPP